MKNYFKATLFLAVLFVGFKVSGSTETCSVTVNSQTYTSPDGTFYTLCPSRVANGYCTISGPCPEE